MKKLTYVDEMTKRYPKLAACKEEIISAYSLMEECYESGGKLLIAGNGGSAADSEHIAGELMKRFTIPRPIDDAYARLLMKTWTGWASLRSSFTAMGSAGMSLSESLRPETARIL